jgi:hypothetical protein
MKIRVQWATNPARGWEVYDHTEWPDLPTKPAPVGGEVLDDQPGWIFDLNVQGVFFRGSDHYAVYPSGPTLVVATWNDDPEDREEAEFYANVWTFWAVKKAKAPSPPATHQEVSRLYGNDYKQWRLPNKVVSRHGIWLPDSLMDDMLVHPPAPWMDWIDNPL